MAHDHLEKEKIMAYLTADDIIKISEAKVKGYKWYLEERVEKLEKRIEELEPLNTIMKKKYSALYEAHDRAKSIKHRHEEKRNELRVRSDQELFIPLKKHKERPTCPKCGALDYSGLIV